MTIEELVAWINIRRDVHAQRARELQGKTDAFAHGDPGREMYSRGLAYNNGVVDALDLVLRKAEEK